VTTATATAHPVRSRYLILSENAYSRADGTVVRLGYLSRTARFFSLDRENADRLERGDVTAITRATLRELERLGAVVETGLDEPAGALSELRTGSDSLAHRRFTIMPTAYCNMGCSYCGQEHYKSPASAARMERLIARVEAVMADERTGTVSVTWFGGEPLLGYRVIREMSTRFVAQAQATGTRYSARMATNGSLISVPKLTELHDEFALRHAEITLDGPPPIHDRRRILKNGRGSFDHCVGVLAELDRSGAAPDLRINIRVNIDNENEVFVPDLLRRLAADGLNAPRFTLQFMPVHSWGNDVSAVEIEARAYAAREVPWLQLAAELGFKTTLLPTRPKATTCIATTRSGEIHDPGGKVYSCSEHPLVPVVRDTGAVALAGELAEAQPRPAGDFDDWYDQVAGTAQPCHGCPFLPVCGGSCPKLWREGHLPCPSFKFNAQQRLDLVATTRWGLRRVAAEGGGGAAWRS